MQTLTKPQNVRFSLRYFCTIALTTTVLLSGCSQPPKIEKIEGFAQGTTYHISYWSTPSVPVDKVKADFSTTLAQIDKELSTYRNDSYISKFNHSTSTDWQSASPDFIQLIQIAQTIYQKTNGCYDPTIGPLFNLWGFKQDVLHVPTQQQIDTTKENLGMNKIDVDRTGKRIRKMVPKLQIDFSSMGEGYTIGKLSHILESKGITNYLVEFGGDMKIQGHKPDGSKWRIAIESPVPSKDGLVPYKIMTVKDETGVTLDTSGTYRHHFDKNGKRYSHILNPRTGKPVTHDLVSASVFGTDSRVSDAWATAMLCLGPVEGAEIAKRENLSVYFIENKNNKLIHFQSPAFTHSKQVTVDQK